jgi:hypothetical protein
MDLTGGQGRPLLIAGGYSNAGDPLDCGIAAWDGTQWARLRSAPGSVRAMTVFDDDGAGPHAPALYVAGYVYPNQSIARWNGQTWTNLTGIYGVQGFAVADFDGPGPGLAQLFVVGSATSNGSHRLMRMGANGWSVVAAPGLSYTAFVYSLASPGEGSKLFVCGTFYTPSSQSYSIASWDGTNWTPYVDGPDSVRAMARISADGESGAPADYATGTIAACAGRPAGYFARLGCGECYANCDRSAVAPVLNVLDFHCFLNRFASGDAYANCDGSTAAPVLNVLDFNCFLDRFAAGCP